MSLKKLLFLPLLVSLLFFAYYSAPVLRSFERLVQDLQITSGLVAVLVAAIALQLIGHWLRAWKTTLLFNRVKENSVRFQFRALSVGYLFNAILPFRLGELVRARIISSGMTISFGYALILIIFERLIDAILLGLTGLVVIIVINHITTASLIGSAMLLLVIGSLLLGLYILAMRQNRRLLGLWHRVTRVFNEELKTSFRFKGWSMIYGLQRSLTKDTVKRYLLLTAGSWILYAASMVLVVQFFFGVTDAGHEALLTLAPYYGVAIPSGPANLGTFSDVIGHFTQAWTMDGSTLLSFTLTAWAVMILPTSLIGLALLLGKTRETLWQTRPKNASRSSLENKLYRQEDISGQMKHFLDNYFSGNSLSRVVHTLELSEGFRLLRYFKGGSDAITILALQDGQEVVKKIIPLEYEDRLKAQYDWLAERKDTPGIVNVLTEERTDSFYSIDMEYDPKNEMFYEFIHRNTIDKSHKIMDQVWKSLYAELYGSTDKLKSYPEHRQAYIDKHIFGCLEKAGAVDPELLRAAEPERLSINGVEYDNLHQIMKRIRKHPQAWEDIATYQRSGVVHGDVIVDNLLVHEKTRKVLIIDPAPDGNIIEGPVFDFGKNLQSLYCGYETLLRDEDPVFIADGNRIDFRDQASDKYRMLSDYVRNELAPRYLSEGEQRAMLFHAAALYIRRLKHQVFYTPENALKFYAVGVRTLNDFLAQYDDMPKAKPVSKRPKKRR